jgi:hypothetical protein
MSISGTFFKTIRTLLDAKWNDFLFHEDVR